MKKVCCESVNYYNRGTVNEQGMPAQLPAASVIFNFIEENSNMNQFSLTFNNISEPIEYFPGKIYTLSLLESTSEE